MKPVFKFALTVIGIIGLGGCMQTHQGSKQTGGTLIAAGLGALEGAAFGNEIGQSLDRADRLHLSRPPKLLKVRR